MSSHSFFTILTLPSAGNRHPGNALAGCGTASKVKRQDDLPDLSCPAPSDSDTSMTTMTMSTTTSSGTSSITTTSGETSSSISPPSTTSGSFCTVVYEDGSSCIQVPDSSCDFGSMVICPLAKRGAHAATATTFFATGSFVTARPTVVRAAA